MKYYHSDFTVQDFLPFSKWSRTSKKKYEIRGIVIHWVNNAGSNAKQNRDYFAKLSGKYASSEYVVDENQIIACIPDNEVAFHVGNNEYTPLGNTFNKGEYTPNYFLLGIELCHPDASGKFKENTLKLAASLVAEKVTSYGLSLNQIYRHGDIASDLGVPRNCPKYFMENEEEWKNFKKMVLNALIEATAPDYKNISMKRSKELGLLESEEWIKEPEKPAPMWAVCMMLNRLYDKLKS